MLSEVALARGDTQAAAQHLQASLAIVAKFYRELQATQKLAGTPDALPVDLIPLSARAALVAAAQGQAERAVTLAGLSASVRAQSRQVLIPPLQAKLDEALAALRAELSAAAFDLAWQTGQRLSLAEAFAFLLA